MLVRRAFARVAPRASAWLLATSLVACAEGAPDIVDFAPIEPPPRLDASLPPDGGLDGGSDGGSDASVCAPGNPDEPDDALFDANCDGIDGDAALLVFVAANGNDTTGDGTRTKPYLTIAKGIEAAVAKGAGFGVAVSQGTYAGRVVLVDGVSVYGGYDRAANWARSLENTTTIQVARTVAQAGPDGTTYVEAVLAENLTERTVLDGFTIVAGDPAMAPLGFNASVYGVRVVGCTEDETGGVVLRNLNVTSGRASAGSLGLNGAIGEGGSTGTVGGFSGSGRATGGAGAVSTCGAEGVVNATRGGQGGIAGNDTLAGCGGAGDGGNGAAPTGDLACQWLGQGGPGGGFCTGQRGENGGDGTDLCGMNLSFVFATPAVALGSVGAVSSRLFFASMGNANGARGGHGVGGSGGGGSGGDACTAGFCYGASGGGGGSGGCGGYPGNGGRGGGSSVALLIVDSTGVVVEGSTFTSGQGGNGGVGGNGGTGGGGGTGGMGGSGKNQDFTVTYGGSGGQGRQGGRGGAGGGGAGGASLAQVVCNSTVTGVSEETGTPGAPGGGGNGGNATAPLAQRGPAGPTGAASALLMGCSL